MVLALAAVGSYAVLQAAKAGRQALAAKAALVRAESAISARNLEPARAELVSAKRSLQLMKKDLHGLGPLLPISRVIPLVRSQVLAVETFQSAGTRLADAGLRLSDAVQTVADTAQGESPLSGVLDALQAIDASLSRGAQSVRVATKDVTKLKGKWLIGPIAGARDDLLARLPRYEKQATSAADGMNALIRFVGGDGLRRYLFLSQNPDEIRPTGGYLGTYGVLTAAPGNLTLDRFESTSKFRERHPDAVVPDGQTRSPFRFAGGRITQSIANVNSLADFNQAGKWAADVWNGAGEPHVDGVVSFTPAFLARLLGVLGPVAVPDYGETVDQANVIERFTYYTAQLEVDLSNDVARKGFLGSLAEVVIGKLLLTPASKWQAVGEAVGQGFAVREAMAWSSDAKVSANLAARGWDGVLPPDAGDFFYNAEFSYAAKVDRGLQRSFDHHVELRADGAARITTKMTLTNTRDAGILNTGSLSYVTMYGPRGATLDPASDPPVAAEPALAGHPAAGWFLNAPPHGSASMTVVWDVKNLLQKRSSNAWNYSLRWLRVPDHSGDAVNLRIDLPAGWSWKGSPPPARIDLAQDVRATWVATPSGSSS